jgi:hypothetical protein
VHWPNHVQPQGHNDLLGVAEAGRRSAVGVGYTAAITIRWLDSPIPADGVVCHDRGQMVADALARNDQRRVHRRDAWRQHAAAERALEAAYHRIIRHDRSRVFSDDGDGLEL